MDETQILKILPSDFPLDDLQAIGERLEKSGAIIPGYIPGPIGQFDWRHILYEQECRDATFIVFPDRNLVTRLAEITVQNIDVQRGWPHDIAIDLMAFAQAYNWLFEPSIAYHELAQTNGQDRAIFELARFRVADTANAHSWIALAQGRTESIQFHGSEFEERELGDLELPLRRWNRNYIVSLKMAELELSSLSHLEKWHSLINWMIDDFILAGPASIYAALYFSTKGRTGGLLKNLRGQNNERAIAGIKNAAWDITYLSEFARAISEDTTGNMRYLFTTGDRLLASIAQTLVTDPYDERGTESDLTNWWSDQDAKLISLVLTDCSFKISAPQSRQERVRNPDKKIEQFIIEGEQAVLAARSQLNSR